MALSILKRGGIARRRRMSSIVGQSHIGRTILSRSEGEWRHEFNSPSPEAMQVYKYITAVSPARGAGPGEDAPFRPPVPLLK